MEENKRNPIGYRNSTRMEAENRMNDEQTAQGATSQSANAQEQAARDHFENGGWQDKAREVFEDTERTNDLLDKEEEFSNKKGAFARPSPAQAAVGLSACRRFGRIYRLLGVGVCEGDCRSALCSQSARPDSRLLPVGRLGR